MLVLLTGFGPFGDVPTNPSELAVRELASRGLPGVDLATEVLPVEIAACVPRMVDLVTRVRPDIVIATGYADRPMLTIERVALNLLDARIPDNSGAQPVGQPVVVGAPTAYLATTPVKAMAAAVRAAGVPCALSLSAGTFACNAVMFAALHHAPEGTRVGFVHVPPLARLGLERLALALEIAARTALSTTEDLVEPAGEPW